jgi:hypothetical protein
MVGHSDICFLIAAEALIAKVPENAVQLGDIG